MLIVAIGVRPDGSGIVTSLPGDRAAQRKRLRDLIGCRTVDDIDSQALTHQGDPLMMWFDVTQPKAVVVNQLATEMADDGRKTPLRGTVVFTGSCNQQGEILALHERRQTQLLSQLKSY